jgi:DNA-binding protein YbaB
MNRHPLQDVELRLELVLTGQTAISAIEIAERRNQSPVEMLADLLKVAIDEDMVDAIIDDGRGER